MHWRRSLAEPVIGYAHDRRFQRAAVSRVLRQRMPDSMKPSMSPSKTASGEETSYSVRRSLTIWYGCSTYDRIWEPQLLPPSPLSALSSRLAVLPRPLQQPGLQHPQRRRLVLQLGLLVLAGNDDAGR